MSSASQLDAPAQPFANGGARGTNERDVPAVPPRNPLPPSYRAPAGFNLLDRQISGDVRVRRWHHRAGPTRFAPGAHPAIELAWVQEGQISYRIGRKHHVVPPRTAFFVPVHVEHATSVLPGTRAGSVWLSSELVRHLADGIHCPRSSDPVAIDNAAHVMALGELLLTEAADVAHRTFSPGEAMDAIDALTESLALAALRADVPRQRRAGPRDGRIGAALSFIETHYAEEIGVLDIARAAGLSRFHMSRLFREELGMSPYRFLQKTRVQRAAEILRLQDRSVTEAALSVGFSDLGRFSRAFRNELGCLPSAFAGKVRPLRVGAH